MKSSIQRNVICCCDGCCRSLERGRSDRNAREELARKSCEVGRRWGNSEKTPFCVTLVGGMDGRLGLFSEVWCFLGYEGAHALWTLLCKVRL